MARPRHRPAPVSAKIIRALGDALAVGDAAAARKSGISVRTLERWRSKYGDDPAVAGCVEKNHAVIEPALAEMRIAGMRELLGIILRRARNDEEPLRDIVGALKIVGDLDLAARLTVERASGQHLEREEMGAGGAPIGARVGVHNHLDAQ